MDVSVVVTLEADCRRHPRSLTEIERHLSGGGVVGGGTKVVPERCFDFDD